MLEAVLIYLAYALLATVVVGLFAVAVWTALAGTTSNEDDEQPTLNTRGRD